MLQELLYKGFLKEEEEILLTIHKHLILIKSRLLKVFALGIVIPALMAWLFPPTLPFALVWAWIGILRIIYVAIDWYYDAWLITNISIIQITWDGFFKKSSTRTEYHHVEGIAYDIQGFWATLWNYGTIVIEKETGNQIMFEHASNPKKKVEQMLVYQDHFVTQKNIRDHRTLKGLVTDLLGHHFKTHVLGKKKP